jgi:hypothetical protein
MFKSSIPILSPVCISLAICTEGTLLLRLAWVLVGGLPCYWWNSVRRVWSVTISIAFILNTEATRCSSSTDSRHKVKNHG